MTFGFLKDAHISSKADILDYLPVPFFAILYGKKGEIKEICSRSLAVLLLLKEGTHSSEDMILKQIGLTKEQIRKEKASFTFRDRKIDVAYVPVEKKGTKEVTAELFWFTDKTQSLKTKDALSRQLEKTAGELTTLHYILNALPFAFWIRNRDKKIIYVNQAYADIVDEKKPEDVLMNQTELLKGNTIALKERNALETAKEKEIYLDLVKGGTKNAFKIRIFPLTENETLGLAEDVSAIAGKQQKLKKENDVLKEAFENDEVGIAVFDADGYILKANGKYRDMFKIPASMVEENMSFGHLLEKMKEEETLPVSADFKEYKKREIDKLMRVRDKSVELISFPKGKIIERKRKKMAETIVDFYEDKTEQVKEQRKAKVSHQMMQKLSEGLPLGILQLDSNKHVIAWNGRFKETWGLARLFLERSPHLEEVFAEQALKIKSNVKNLEKHLMSAVENPENEEIDFGSAKMTILRFADGSLWLCYS